MRLPKIFGIAGSVPISKIAPIYGIDQNHATGVTDLPDRGQFRPQTHPAWLHLLCGSHRGDLVPP